MAQKATLFHHKPTQTAKSEESQRESSRDLKDWFEVSWFFPPDFELKHIASSEESHSAVGKHEIYKFFRPSDGNRTFELRCRAASQEIIDHEKLAPGLYKGIKPLRWIEDEPIWLRSEMRLEPEGIDADDVAIIMRRLPTERRLDFLLFKDTSFPNNRTVGENVSAVARRLADFHRSEAQQQPMLLNDPDRMMKRIRDTFLHEVDSFIHSHGSFLDPFSMIQLRESRSFLFSYLEQNYELFIERMANGRFSELHGNLRLENIYFADGVDSMIVDRVSANSTLRVGDPLSDAASLFVDLQAKEFVHAAKIFKRSYLKSNPEAGSDALWRFFSVGHALRRVVEIFTKRDSEESDLPLAEAQQYLSFAFQTTFVDEVPKVLVVNSKDDSESNFLARAISEILPYSYLDANSVRASISDYHEPEDITLEKLIARCRLETESGRSVVLSWDFTRYEQYYLINTALRGSTTLAFIENSSLLSQAPGDVSAVGGGLNTVPVDTSLSSPELALYVLREVNRGF